LGLFTPGLGHAE